MDRGTLSKKRHHSVVWTAGMKCGTRAKYSCTIHINASVTSSIQHAFDASREPPKLMSVLLVLLQNHQKWVASTRTHPCVCYHTCAYMYVTISLFIHPKHHLQDVCASFHHSNSICLACFTNRYQLHVSHTINTSAPIICITWSHGHHPQCLHHPGNLANGAMSSHVSRTS